MWRLISSWSRVKNPQSSRTLSVEPEKLFQLPAHCERQPRPHSGAIRQLQRAQLPLGSRAAVALPRRRQIIVVGSARKARPSIKARRPRRLSGTTTPAPIIWLKITHTKIGIFSCSMILDLRVSNIAFLERRLLNSLSSRISSFFSQL